MCAEQVTDLDGLLAVGGELRPVAGDGGVEIELAASATISAQRTVMVLVVDQTFVIVSRSQGSVPAASAEPAQTSTTSSPSWTTATEAPTSRPWSKLAANGVPHSGEPLVARPVHLDHCVPLG